MNSSTLANEPINIFGNAFFGTAVSLSCLQLCLFYLPYLVFFKCKYFIDTCLHEYYDNSGLERQVVSAGRPCLNIIRSETVSTRLRLWFESTIIPQNKSVVVSLKSSSEMLIKKYYLTSNDSGYTKSFDALNRGDWFEIQERGNVTFDLKFKAYTNCKCILPHDHVYSYCVHK